MFINLDQIEFYHGPSRQKPGSESSSTRGKQSWIPYTTEPIHLSLPVGPVFPPGSPALTLSANGSEPHAHQSHDQLSTSRAEPGNVFDVEFGKLSNGIERPQFENAAVTTAEGDNGCLPNGGLGYNDLGGFENGSLGSGKLNDPPEIISGQLTLLLQRHAILPWNKNKVSGQQTYKRPQNHH